jgi:phage-related protein
MTVPALGVEQYQYTDTGVLLNADVNLPFFDVSSVAGLDGTPAVSSSFNSTGQDGGFVDAANEDIRTVTVEGTVYAAPGNLETYLDQLKANFAPRSSDAPFYFRLDDNVIPRMVNGKSQGFVYTKDNRRSIGVVDAQFSIVCADPRVYSSTLLSMTVARGGSNTLVLGGNRPTPPLFQLVGSHTTSGLVITVGSVTLTYNATIASGRTVTIDVLNRLVYDDIGTAGLRDKLVISPVGAWPFLNPGNNLVSLTSAAGTGNLVVSARSAFR